MSDAPERIYADIGPNGGWMYREKRKPDTAHEYIRSDITTLQTEVTELRDMLKRVTSSLFIHAKDGAGILPLYTEACVLLSPDTNEDG